MLEKMTSSEDIDSLMFGSIRDDEEERKKSSDEENCGEEERREKKQRVEMTQCSGKIRAEMQATYAERKDATERKSALLRHGRSPAGGRVMKQQRGTPTKFKNVRGLRKIFEEISSPTKQDTELLLQSSGANLYLPTTTECSRQEPKLCAGQWEGGIQTGPRQEGGLELQQDWDWPSQARLVPAGPIRGEMTEVMQGRVKRGK